MSYDCIFFRATADSAILFAFPYYFFEAIFFVLGERELVEFLTEEILAERKAQKNNNIPTEFQGFKVSLDGSEMILTKKTDKETVKIQFSVNHTVDTEVEPEVNSSQDKPDVGELKSKPAFRVDFVRGNTTLSMLCSFIQETDQEEGYSEF